MGQGKQSQESYQVVQRVTSLPLVTSAVSAYDRAKTGSPWLLARSLGMAEAMARFAYTSATPIMNQFPLEYVDRVACQGLDVLEHQVPAIRSQPEELIEVTKGYLGVIKGFGESRVTRTLVFGLGTMDRSLSMADTVVDKLLPPSDEEMRKNGFVKEVEASEQAKERAVQVVDHAVLLGEKVKFRITQTAVVKLGDLRATSHQVLTRLSAALEDVSVQLKQNPAFMTASRTLLDNITRMLEVSRRFLPNVDAAMLERARDHARELYASFSQQLLASDALKRAREQVGNLQDLLNTFFRQALHMSGLSHFLPASVTNAISPATPNGLNKTNGKFAGSGEERNYYTPREDSDSSL